jgi:hypothetical protein
MDIKMIRQGKIVEKYKNKLKDRIEERLECLGKSKADLALGVGESSQNINNWLKRKNIPHGKRNNVAKFLMCTVEYIVDGKVKKESDIDGVVRDRVHDLVDRILFQNSLTRLEVLLTKMVELEDVESSCLKNTSKISEK